MSILSLLFGFISFLLLALDPVNLIQIVVLVSIHISVIHVVSLFLVVGINLCIAKLLLFPTIQKPDRHLAMTKGYTDAMKPEKFTGVNFKRWQTRAQLWLTAMGVFWVVGNPPALPLGSEKEVEEFTAATTIFVGCVLSVLSDQLCDVYMNIKSAAELWEALEHKFGAADAGHELYVMEKYHDFKMVENRSVVEQAHEFQLIVRELEQLGHVLPDKFVAAGIIAKLPPSWRNFATALKHKRQKISVEDLLAGLDVEEKARAKDAPPKAPEQSSANVMQHAGKNK